MTTLDEMQILSARMRIKWATIGFTVTALIVLWAYLIRPISDYVLSCYGMPVPPPANALNVTDVLMLLGFPVSGAYADKFNA